MIIDQVDIVDYQVKAFWHFYTLAYFPRFNGRLVCCVSIIEIIAIEKRYEHKNNINRMKLQEENIDKD